MAGFDGKNWVQSAKNVIKRTAARFQWKTLTAKTKQLAFNRSIHPWIKRSQKQIIIAAGSILVVGSIAYAGSQYVKLNTVEFYNVYMNGKEVGTVSNKVIVDQWLALKAKQEEQTHPDVHMVMNTEGLTFTVDRALNAKPNTTETIKKLDQLITASAAGVELKVNGKVLGIVKDQETADSILEQLKDKYTSDLKPDKQVRTLSVGAPAKSQPKEPLSRLEAVSFDEKVSLGEVKVDPAKVLSEEETLRLLTTGDTKKVTYVVQKGDTVSGIAHKFNISRQVVYKNNPDIDEDFINIGQKLDLTVKRPAITVKTVEKVTENVVIEPETIIQKDPKMRKGQQKLVRAGKSGMKQMSYRLTKKNGDLINEEWLGQQVIEAAVPEIVIKGTMVVLGEGTGKISWPVIGARLSSSYGKRWGRLHKGVDLISSNKSIIAADNGVVTFAGKKNGLGNAIIINHKNGMETVYGHLSKITTKKGAVVEKGQKIGIMGNTGHSFGTHLHFEVHKSGDIKNPMNFLNRS